MTRMLMPMLLPNGEVLKHEDAPYDPVKAHDYYIRTRHLKGRRAAQDFSVTTQYGRTETLSPQELQEQRAYASHRVSVITTKLSDLKTKLAAAIAEAAKTTTPKTKTAADKTKAAAKAKTYRQSHEQTIKTKATEKSATKTAATTTTKKTSTSTGTDINSLQDKIAVTHQNLLDAVAKQRRLAAAKKTG